ncbi:MAG: hypothetical protein P4L22_00315 [Candidatus Babeliales bacterium]|nr:hypothetical protein [Candidatus Babeliales bacterium]
MKNLKFILLILISPIFQRSILFSADSHKFTKDLDDLLGNIIQSAKGSPGLNQKIMLKIDSMLNVGFNINTLIDDPTGPITLLDIVTNPSLVPNEVLAKYIIKKGGKKGGLAAKAMRDEITRTISKASDELSSENHRNKIKHQPACCKQKADGQTCNYSDECRGSCKCKFPTIAKKCAFGAGGTCINQAKHCDVSKCVS